MTASALVELLQLVENEGIKVWLDGGWAVDASLEKQTRLHKDMDIILQVSDVPGLCEFLAPRGFSVREGFPPNGFVLADGSGLEVDVHAVVFNDDGSATYRMENGKDWIFPAEGFTGRGIINGHSVGCLTPGVQVLCHAHGYTPVEKDFRDMELLHQRFGVELPSQLRRPAARHNKRNS